MRGKWPGYHRPGLLGSLWAVRLRRLGMLLGIAACPPVAPRSPWHRTAPAHPFISTGAILPEGFQSQALVKLLGCGIGAGAASSLGLKQVGGWADSQRSWPWAVLTAGCLRRPVGVTYQQPARNTVR